MKKFQGSFLKAEEIKEISVKSWEDFLKQQSVNGTLFPNESIEKFLEESLVDIFKESIMDFLKEPSRRLSGGIYEGIRGRFS